MTDEKIILVGRKLPPTDPFDDEKYEFSFARAESIDDFGKRIEALTGAPAWKSAKEFIGGFEATVGEYGTGPFTSPLFELHNMAGIAEADYYFIFYPVTWDGLANAWRAWRVDHETNELHEFSFMGSTPNPNGLVD